MNTGYDLLIQKIFKNLWIFSCVLLFSCSSTPDSPQAEQWGYGQQIRNSNPYARQGPSSYRSHRTMTYNQRRVNPFIHRYTQPDQVQPPATVPIPQTPQEQLKLGEQYAFGRGVARNDEEAFKLFRMAAEQGNAEAQYKLAVMLDKGMGTFENPKEALTWYKRAAEHGHAGAENNIGNFYNNGRGVPQDKREAERWYRLSAAHGEEIGKQNLALLLNKKTSGSYQANGDTEQHQNGYHTEDGGPFTGNAADYLNALYRRDFDAVDAMDRQFAKPFQQAINWMGQSGMYSLYAALSGGRFSGEGIGKTMSEATANLSMVGPLAVAYIVNYEHIYPECMDASPLKYSQTTISQTVTKNMLGLEVYRSPAVSRTDHFNVNHRFKEIFDDVGTTDNSQAAFADKIFGDPNGVKLLDVLADMRQAMHSNKCNSKVMHQLEANMFAKYKDSGNKIRAANRHI